MTTWSTLITYGLLSAFLRPLAEALLWAVGEFWAHAVYRIDGSMNGRLIIQITTLGREADRVNQIINEIRAFELELDIPDYEIWVVNEPDMPDAGIGYPLADLTLTVPETFTARSRCKARALEFSRRYRRQMGIGLDGDDTKLLFLDDDVSPTRNYIIAGYIGDYDLCQGVTAPRVQYGTGGIGHWFLSHMDDMRFLACSVWCSFTQGVIKYPVYTHGEGLFARATAEQLVTWDYEIFASEDLVFGQNAKHHDLTWGFFHEYIQLTSPWTAADYIRQRRRWLWGNVDAITHRGILPVWGRIVVSLKYLAGILTFVSSAAATVLLFVGDVNLPGEAWVFFWGAFAMWIGAFAVSGWVNSGNDDKDRPRSARFWSNRVFQTLSAVVLCPVTCIWTAAALVIALLKGKPAGFEVIAKTKSSAYASRKGGACVRKPSKA